MDDGAKQYSLIDGNQKCDFRNTYYEQQEQN